MKDEVWVFTQESCVDGEVTFSVEICSSRKVAEDLLMKATKDARNNLHIDSRNRDEYVLEKTDNSFFVQLTSDCYYEQIEISLKPVR